MKDKRSPIIPWELIICVLAFIPLPRISTLLTISKTFQAIAEPILYRHINLANCPIRCLNLFDALIKRPRLGRHILTFRIADGLPQDRLSHLLRLIRVYRGVDEWHRRQTVYQRTSGQVTYLLTNVEAVDVAGSIPGFNTRLDQLQNVKKFRLINATYVFRSYTSIFEAFPHATHVELPTNVAIRADGIGPHHLPLVEELICKAEIAAKVVPGRPVQRLFLTFPGAFGSSTYDMMLKIGRGSARVSVLGLSVDKVWEGETMFIVDAAGRFLPDVEELHLSFRFWRSQREALSTVLEALPRDLETFTSLRLLDFRGSVGHGVGWFNYRRVGLSKIYLRELRLWSHQCPTLMHVVFPNGLVWTRTESSDWVCKNMKLTNTSIPTREGATPWGHEPMFRKDLGKDEMKRITD